MDIKENKPTDRNAILKKEIKSKLEKTNDRKTLEFIYEYLKIKNIKDEELKEKYKNYKYMIIVRIIDELEEMINYYLLRIESVARCLNKKHKEKIK